MKTSRRLSSNIAMGASLLALTFAGNAFAQDAKTQASGETVVVTATGRAKAVQDIPIALTAVTAQTIQAAGITDVRNLQQVAPAYKVQTGQSNASSAQITVRGIGTGSDNPGYEGAVAVFVDGVYRNRSGVALTDLPKVDRIEILRGPQGTLFGRNTSAGAVSIITAAPKFDRNIYGKVEMGSLGLISSSLGYTNGISENTAIRLELGGTTRDGLLKEVNTGKEVNNRNRWYARAQTLTDLGEDATLRLIFDTSASDEVCCSAVRVKSGSLAPAIQLVASLRGLKGIPTINEEAAEIANTPGRVLTEQTEETGVSGELNWNTGLGKFTSITSYRTWDLLRGQDVDFSGIDRAYRDNYTLGFDTFTQEFRLNGKKDKLDWLVGAFYLSEDTKFNDSVKYGADAARYADAVASGLDLNGPAPGGTGFSVYRSLPGQTATPLLFQAALTPTLITQLTGIVGAPTAAVLGPQIAAAYAASIMASAPVDGEGQQQEKSDVSTKSISVFTHNVFDLTDTTSVTFGLRYNRDEKDVTSVFNANTKTCAAMQSTAAIVTGVPITNQSLTRSLEATPLGAYLSLLCNPILNTVANGTHKASSSESAWNGTLSVSHDFSDDIMVYAGYSRGYKSGGFNYDRSAFKITPSGTAAPNVNDWIVKPEFTDNYEIGAKLSGLPGRTTLNAALFYEAITDYQMNAWTGFNFRSFNVAEMVSQGFELDLTSRPITGLTLTGGMLINEATFESDVILPTSANPAGEIVLAAGSNIANAPKLSLTSSLNYRQPIEGTSLAWNFYVDALYVSKMRVQTLFRDPITDQKAYTVVNARLGIGGENGSWGLELWGRNIGDTLYHQYALGIPEQTGEFAHYKTEPRTYGVTLRASF